MLRSFKNRASSVFRRKRPAATTTTTATTELPPTTSDGQFEDIPRFNTAERPRPPPPPPPPPLYSPTPVPSTTSTQSEQDLPQQEQPEDQQNPVDGPVAPDAPAPNPLAPKYVPYIEASPLKNNMFAGNAGRYGRVNPAIMGGFGDDDDSIWLVDDEETDGEQQQPRDNQARSSSSVDDRSQIGSRHSTSSSLHPWATTHQQPGPGPAPPASSQPAFRYQMPSLLDDDDLTSGTISAPEPPPTQSTAPAPRRGYAPIASSILNLNAFGVDNTDMPPPVKTRNDSTTPSSRPQPAVVSASSSSVNPYVALFEQQDNAMTMAYLRQLEQSEDEVADDFRFGQRYQKARDSSDVIVTHQRTPASTVTGELECVVCADIKGVNAFPRFSVTASCTHAPGTCLDCVQLSIESDLSSKLWTEIRCPECRELLEYADIQRYANKQTFARYETLALRAAMSEAEHFVWCTSGCGSGQIHESGSEQPIVTCLHCRHRSCFHHNVAWHETLSCDEYDQLLADPDNFRSQLELENEKWSEAQRAQLEADRAMAHGLLAEERAELKRREERARQEREQAEKAAKLARQIASRLKKEEAQSWATVSRTTKPCPGCGWAIEKNEGCSHMTCKLILEFPTVPPHCPLRLNPAPLTASSAVMSFAGAAIVSGAEAITITAVERNSRRLISSLLLVMPLIL
ncbi:hypothetical protein FZEAL_3416 [Fusarium zealandicum]|uniref:RBR-type E3 ubiquitin transferase n=1 Tax=Fusarium zealandicum TaxID=1053134 RepID=A0A8H4XLT8_9HYPO|nr:hypothetical protein FZEAL_3416 [Fusarium zealandicum]